MGSTTLAAAKAPRRRPAAGAPTAVRHLGGMQAEPGVVPSDTEVLAERDRGSDRQLGQQGVHRRFGAGPILRAH